jgi:hypothetical protein
MKNGVVVRDQTRRQAPPDIPMAPRRLKISRITILIPAGLDQNLEICRLKLGISKNDVIKQALIDFVKANKLDPDKTPRRLTVSY